MINDIIDFNIEDLLSLKPFEVKNTFNLLNDLSILKNVLPELIDLKGVDETKETFHKDNYLHTIQVVENTYYVTENKAIRLASILHDIGKATTKKWIDNVGWSFHNHEYVGSKMLKSIFERLDINNDYYDLVYKIVLYHGIPKEFGKKGQVIVSESALRRFDKDLGNDLESLLLFCKCDSTTSDEAKKIRQNNFYDLLYSEILKLRLKDKESEWRCVITGEMIMEYFNVKGKIVGEIKSKIENEIKCGNLKNELPQAFEFMKNIKL